MASSRTESFQPFTFEIARRRKPFQRLISSFVQKLGRWIKGQDETRNPRLMLADRIPAPEWLSDFDRRAGFGEHYRATPPPGKEPETTASPLPTTEEEGTDTNNDYRFGDDLSSDPSASDIHEAVSESDTKEFDLSDELVGEAKEIVGIPEVGELIRNVTEFLPELIPTDEELSHITKAVLLPLVDQVIERSISNATHLLDYAYSRVPGVADEAFSPLISQLYDMITALIGRHILALSFYFLLLQAFAILSAVAVISIIKFCWKNFILAIELACNRSRSGQHAQTSLSSSKKNPGIGSEGQRWGKDCILDHCSRQASRHRSCEGQEQHLKSNRENCITKLAVQSEWSRESPGSKSSRSTPNPMSETSVWLGRCSEEGETTVMKQIAKKNGREIVHRRTPSNPVPEIRVQLEDAELSLEPPVQALYAVELLDTSSSSAAHSHRTLEELA